MTVHDGVDIGTRPVDFAVDEALQVDASSGRVERFAVEIEGDEVFTVHEAGCHVAGEQKVPGRTVVARAHVPEAVDHALVVENAVGEHEPVEERRIGSGRCHRVLTRVRQGES